MSILCHFFQSSFYKFRRMGRYMFPFNTCESTSDESWPKQPVSFMLNMVTTMVLLLMARRAPTVQSRVAIYSLVLFEFVHAASHAWHIRGHVQQNTMHFLTYIIAATLWWALVDSTGHVFTTLEYTMIAGLLMVDVASVASQRTFPMLLSGSFILASVLLVFTPHLNNKQYILVPWIVLAAVCGITLVFLEQRYCTVIMSWKPFPYHSLVEMSTFSVFVMLANLLKNC